MKPTKKTLKEYIDSNQHLLSALAVTSGLIVYFGTLPYTWLVTLFSFALITGMVVLFREVQANTISFKETSLNLGVFNVVIVIGYLGVSTYWLLRFREVWHTFLFIPFTIWFFSLFSFFGDRFIKELSAIPALKKWFFKESNEPNEFLRLIKRMFLIAEILLSFYCGANLAGPANVLLDWLAQHPEAMISVSQYPQN